MKDERSRAPRRFGIKVLARLLRKSSFILHPSFFVLLLCLFPACTPQQQRERIEDVEPERLVNTELTFPKNPQRWAFVATRVSTDPKDPFAGYRVVVANPLAARAREENRATERGSKFAQFIYEPSHSTTGIAPGTLLRVNILVQDPEKYGATGGWGFASFDGAQLPISVEPRTDCMSCHTAGPLTR
jgi:hypothetical protein